MNSPAVVVFDLDGTLMDHGTAARRGLAAWLDGLGHPLTDELTTAWATAEARHFTAWRDGHISFVEQRRRRLRDVLPLLGEQVGTDEELDEVFAGYLAAYEDAWKPYPDVLPCLTTLSGRGFRLAVLTNGDDAQQRRKLGRLGVADHVPHVFTAGALGVAKPDPRAFDAVAASLGVDPPSCLYVGDDHEVDVLGARAAGWRAVHLDRAGERLDAASIRSLGELPDLLDTTS